MFIKVHTKQRDEIELNVYDIKNVHSINNTYCIGYGDHEYIVDEDAYKFVKATLVDRAIYKTTLPILASLSHNVVGSPDNELPYLVNLAIKLNTILELTLCEDQQ